MTLFIGIFSLRNGCFPHRSHRGLKSCKIFYTNDKISSSSFKHTYIHKHIHTHTCMHAMEDPWPKFVLLWRPWCWGLTCLLFGSCLPWVYQIYGPWVYEFILLLLRGQPCPNIQLQNILHHNPNDVMLHPICRFTYNWIVQPKPTWSVSSFVRTQELASLTYLCWRNSHGLCIKTPPIVVDS